MAPRLQLVVRQNPLARLGRERLHDAITAQLASQCRAIPVRPGPPAHVRTLAGPCDHGQRHHRGKQPAGGRGVLCRTTRRGPTPQNAAPICGHAVHAVPHGVRWWQTSPRPPTVKWPGPVWPRPPASSVSAATLGAWHEWGHQGQCGVRRGVLACRSPRRGYASMRTNPSPQCQFFRPFSMGTCT